MILQKQDLLNKPVLQKLQHSMDKKWLVAGRSREFGWWRILYLCIGWWVLFGDAQRVVSANPTVEEAEYLQGRASFSHERYADAADHFQRALTLMPTNSVYAQWLGRAYGLEAQRASLFARAGLAVRSREALERAVQLDPENLGARSDLAAYYAAAPGFLGGGLDKARAQVEQIKRRDPYRGLVRGGDLLWDDDRPVEAEAAYLAAVRLDSKRPDAHDRLGSLYLDQKKYAQAFAQWDAVLASEREQARALFGLGKTAALSGERQSEGIAALRGYLQRRVSDGESPPPAKAHYYLGMLLAKQGDPVSARKEYETALQLRPQMEEAKQALQALPSGR